jgi:hypothetical protein
MRSPTEGDGDSAQTSFVEPAVRSFVHATAIISTVRAITIYIFRPSATRVVINI